MGNTLRIVEGSLDAYRKFYERIPAVNRLLFNSPEFLSYRDPNPLTFLEWRNHNFTFAQSACWIKPTCNGGTSIVIPGGASFGGPIAQRRLRFADYSDLLDALVKYAGLRGCSQIEWTPPSPHHWEGGDEEAEFAAIRFGFRIEVAGLESVVTLPARHESKFNNLLRKCKREGVEYIGDIELDDFYPTLEHVYSRHQASPTHSKAELRLLKSRFPQHIRFVGTARGNELAATACLFRVSPISDLVFYMCTVDKHKKENPMLMLISEDMHRAQKAGCNFYNFGTSSIGLEVRYNVLSFKQQFGARGFLRRRFLWSLN